MMTRGTGERSIHPRAGLWALLALPLLAACSAGKDSVEATAEPAAEPFEPGLPVTARGHEPGWLLRIQRESIELVADYGEIERSFPYTEAERTAKAVRYTTEADGDRLHATVKDSLCADGATGMPHPYTVEYRLDGDGYQGCGGEPRALLTGEPWRVTALAGEVLDDAGEMTIAFNDAGHVSGRTPCNRFTGLFELTGEGLNLRGLALTRRACADSQQRAREQSFVEQLQSVRRFTMAERERLQLHPSGDAEPIVAER